MPRDPQIETIFMKLDELLDEAEAYRDALDQERTEASHQQPDNKVYLRRIGGAIGQIEQILELLDEQVRDILIQTADISFTKNQSRDPNFH